MQTVIGLFDTAREAQDAVEELKSNGFTTDNIDVSVNDENNLSRSDVSDGSMAGDSFTGDLTNSGTSMGVTGGTQFNDNATTGTASSRVDNHDEGVGSKIGSFFKNLFGNDDDDANRYSTVATKAGSIVTVHAQSKEEAEEAANILDECGAIDVNERASQYGYSSGNGNGSYASGTATGDNNDTLKVIKEDVQVGKKEIETGGVRIRSRIVERPVEEQLRLREEKVTVERTPVDRPATDADFQNFKEGEIEMTERAEIADVSKQARVVEEVKLSKNVNERVQTVHETARDTEVDIENLEPNTISKKK